MKQIENLRVDNPCPMYLRRMKKDGAEFFCGSCKKEVIDFRDKNIKEIKDTINSDTCGIFTSDQLKGQKKMTLSRQVIFYSFMFFSILGFNVSPLSAQIEVKSDSLVAKNQSVKNGKTSTAKVLNNDRKTKKSNKMKKNGLFRRRKKQEFRTIGCPSF